MYSPLTFSVHVITQDIVLSATCHCKEYIICQGATVRTTFDTCMRNIPIRAQGRLINQREKVLRSFLIVCSNTVETNE